MGHSWHCIRESFARSQRCVKLHGFRGLCVLRSGGSRKWACLPYISLVLWNITHIWCLFLPCRNRDCYGTLVGHSWHCIRESFARSQRCVKLHGFYHIQVRCYETSPTFDVFYFRVEIEIVRTTSCVRESFARSQRRVKLHGFRGLCILRSGGSRKWACLPYIS